MKKWILNHFTQLAASFKRAIRKTGCWLCRYVWRGYVLQCLIWLDQGINTVFAPILNLALIIEAWIRRTGRHHLARFGFPDETLSSVFAKNRTLSLWCGWMARMLDRLDTDHSADALEADEGARLDMKKGSRDG